MDEVFRRLEHTALKLGDRHAALLRPHLVESHDPTWERVTLVGLSGHLGCLVNQVREHYYLARVHSIAALAELPGAHLIVDLETRSFVRPTWVTHYLHDFEDAWTPTSDQSRDPDGCFSGPYRPLGPLWRRAPGWRGPMHEEIERCHERYRAARLGYGSTCDDRAGCVHPR